MSSKRQVSEDPADLLASLVDHAQVEPLFRDPVRTAEALASPQFQRASAFVHDAVVTTGRLSSVDMADALAFARDPEVGRLAAMCGLDRSMAHAHPATADGDPKGLYDIAVRYARTGRLSSSAIEGAVLPRWASPGRPQNVPEGIRDLLQSTVRVSGEIWGCAHFVQLNLHFTPRERLSSYSFACSPIMDDIDDLDVELIRVAGNKRFYRIDPSSTGSIQHRICEVLPLLDSSGAVLAVLPELTLTPELLSHWQHESGANARPASSRLRLIFVGTGHIGTEEPPHNTGVLIDRDSGRVILEQNKLFGFTMSPEQLRSWQLSGILGEEVIGEYLTRGDRLTIAETRLGRIAVLICEDLARIEELGRVVGGFGASIVIAPVFSKETIDFYWEHQGGRAYAAAAGAWSIVANSLVIPRAMGERGLVGACLVTTPQTYALGEAASCVDVISFRADDDGEEIQVTQT